MTWLFFLLTMLSPRSGLTETFADGELLHNPTWSGDTLWKVVPWGEDYALRTDGLPQPDTLMLVTTSSIAYGNWTFLLHLASVNLSTANGIRVYLIADTADLTGQVHGYYLQLGTNNMDRVELWRQDGPQRIRLGTGPSRWLTNTTATLSLSIYRDTEGNWKVYADGNLLFQTQDNRYQTGSHFGFWVKHSTATGKSYYFDDLSIQPGIPPVDTTPPRLTAVVPLDAQTLRITFNEAVQGCQPTAYQIYPIIGFPATISPCDSTYGKTYTLSFSRPFQRNILYTLHVRDVPDASGNSLPPTTWTFFYALPHLRDFIINEVHIAPMDPRAEFVELYNRTTDTLQLGTLYIKDASGRRGMAQNVPEKLPPHHFLVLVRDSAAFAHYFPFIPAIEARPWPVLNNRTDAISVFLEHVLLDRMAYQRTNTQDHQSLERRDPDAASHAGENWAPSTAPEGATPGKPNTQYLPDTTPPVLSTLILHDSLHLELVFNEPLDSTQALPPSAFFFSPSTTTLQTAQIPDTADHTLHLYLTTPLEKNTWYTLSYSDIQDYAGNKALGDTTFLGSDGEKAKPGDIVINELFVAPPDPSLEFIELYNRSSRILSLHNLALSDSSGTPIPLTRHSRYLLPNAYVVFAAHPEQLQQVFNMSQSPLPLPQWPTLNNEGDVITLYAGGTVIDRVPYRSSWGTHGVSLERVDPDGPSTWAGNWKPSRAPLGATPGNQNSQYVPDRLPPFPLSAEEQRPGTVYVFLNEPIDSTTLSLEQFRIGAFHPTSLQFLSPTTLILTFPHPLTEEQITLYNLSDLTGNVLEIQTIQIAFAPRKGAVKLNEIMYEPEDFQPEYIELYNLTDTLFTLRWSWLTDERQDTLQLASFLPPHGFSVLFATPGGDSTLLLRAFPSIPRTENVQLLPVSRSTLGLQNDGEHLALYTEGTHIDSVTYRPAWHHPDLLRTRGISLERSIFISQWISSVDPEGGTPGRTNSTSIPLPSSSSTPRLQISPTPFSPNGDGLDEETIITYHLPSPIGHIQVRIFDLSGREVRLLIPAALSGSQGHVRWDGKTDGGRALPTGVYIVFLEAVDAYTGKRLRLKKPVVLVR